MRYAILSLMFGASLSAQAVIEGPVAGWVWNERTAFRAILGIPGAAVQSGSLRPPVPFAQVTISANEHFAIAITAADSSARVLSLGSGALRPIDGVPAGADGAVLSPSGRAAVLAFGSSRRLAVVTGLPGRPEFARDVDLTVEGMPDALAISDDAGALLAAYRDNRLLLAFDEAGNRWRIPHQGEVRDVTFVSGTRDVMIAGESGVWSVSNVTAIPEIRQVWSGSALRVAASPDGRRAIVIGGGEDSLAILELASGEAGTLPCQCKATALTRLSAGVYRIGGRDRGPLWILDLESAQPRPLFVPAGPE